MLIGYERVSTDDQNLNLQHDALKNVGCERIFDEFQLQDLKKSLELFSL